MAVLEIPTKPGATNTSLGAARRAKNDEFYTQLTDIEKELRHYKHHFHGKVVLCNCDDPEWSNFWKYFTLNFEHLGLAKVVATHYAQGEPSYKLEYLGSEQPAVKTPLTGDGDFRSDECVALLKDADIVVTNPPFSLFREYVAQLLAHNKKFLAIGSKNALTYREIFRPLMANQVWLGVTSPKQFLQPDGSFKVFGNIGWFTNLEHNKRNEEIVLFKKYKGNERQYPNYDNFDAIAIARVSEIPADYDGPMGVPITFLDKYNPEQFAILGLTKTWFNFANKKYPQQTQVSANGVESLVTKLNDGAVLKVDSPPAGETYYKVGDSIYIQTYPRVIVKRKGASK